MRKPAVLAALLFVSLLPLLGCSRGGAEEAAMEEVVESYVKSVADRKFDQALELLTGEALEAVKEVLPAVEKANVRSSVSKVETRADFLNRSRDRGSVECSYVLEQTVPGYGTTLNEITAAFDLKKLDGRWLIYSARVISKRGGS